MTGDTSKLVAARDAVQHLRGLFADVTRTMAAPDHIGGRWYELYLGTPVSGAFVCVDAVNNVLHVSYLDRDNLSIVFLPGWFSEVALAALAGQPPDISPTTVLDLAAAVPLAFDLTVESRIDGAAETVRLPDGTVEYDLLPFGYAFSPARGFAVAESPASDLATDPSVLFQWSAMRLRIAAAPGVRFTQRPVLSAAALSAVRAAYVPGGVDVTSNQALMFEFERHRQPMTLPPLGAPFSSPPLAEPDIVASAVTMQGSWAGRTDKPLPVAVQETRTDGVYLLLMKPDLRQPVRGQPWGWLPDWLVKPRYSSTT